MRHAIVLFSIAAVILSIPHADALSHEDGTHLLHDCRAAIRITDITPRLTPAENEAADYCIAYVEGVLDSNDFWHAVDHRDHNSMRHYCIDRDTSTEQVIRILVKYLENNPKELNENGWICLQGALLKDFPCKD